MRSRAAATRFGTILERDKLSSVSIASISRGYLWLVAVSSS